MPIQQTNSLLGWIRAKVTKRSLQSQDDFWLASRLTPHLSQFFCLLGLDPF